MQDLVQSCSVSGFWGFVEMGLVMKNENKPNHETKMEVGPDLYVTKIVTGWMGTDTKQLLSRCQLVQSKIGVISHCLINLICMLFPKL